MIRVIFLGRIWLALSKRIDYDEILWFLEFNNGEPCLVSWYLLGALLNESPIEPKVKGELIEVKFETNYSRGSCAERVSHLVFLILIRYANL